MHPIVALCNTDGVIKRTDMDTGMYPLDGEVFFDGVIHRIYSLEGLSDEAEFLRLRVWEESEQIWAPVPLRPNMYATWNRNLSPPSWDWDHEAILDEVRFERAYKIGITDWTVGNDSPLTEAQKAECILYRQALRDITTTLTKENTPNLESVVWPTKPSFL